eukprot:scaffold1069_cov129-Isochrysis_galbana.AAC.3
MLAQAERAPSGGTESEEPCRERTEPRHELTCSTRSETHATRARGRETSQCGPARRGVAILVRELGGRLAKTETKKKKSGRRRTGSCEVPRSHSARWRGRLAAHGMKRTGRNVRHAIRGSPADPNTRQSWGGLAAGGWHSAAQQCSTFTLSVAEGAGGEGATTRSPRHAVRSAPEARWAPGPSLHGHRGHVRPPRRQKRIGVGREGGRPTAARGHANVTLFAAGALGRVCPNFLPPRSIRPPKCKQRLRGSEAERRNAKLREATRGRAEGGPELHCICAPALGAALGNLGGPQIPAGAPGRRPPRPFARRNRCRPWRSGCIHCAQGWRGLRSSEPADYWNGRAQHWRGLPPSHGAGGPTRPRISLADLRPKCNVTRRMSETRGRMLSYMATSPGASRRHADVCKATHTRACAPSSTGVIE